MIKVVEALSASELEKEINKAVGDKKVVNISFDVYMKEVYSKYVAILVLEQPLS